MKSKSRPFLRIDVIFASALSLVTLSCNLTQLSPAVLPPGPAAPAEVVFRNGVVLTMNAAGAQAQALAIHGGSIVAVGSEAELQPYIGRDTQVVDLQGRALLPGFVDAHSHVYFTAERSIPETQDWLLSQGITTVTEATVDPDMFEWLLRAEADGQLRTRTALYLQYTNSCGEVVGHWYDDHPAAHFKSDFLRVPGIKVFTDGGACNRPAVSFVDAAGGNGDLHFDQAQLTDILLEAQARGYQVLFHALGDRAITEALNTLESVLDGAPNTPRHRIDHNALLRDDLLPRYGLIGVVPVLPGKFPACFWSGDTGQFQYVTPVRYRHWEWRYGELIAASPDLPYAWHADYPVFGSIDPIQHLYGFVTRNEVGPDGQLCAPPDWAVDDRIPVAEALRMMTVNSAYAVFYDDIVGSLEPGKYADLVVLSGNPLQTAPEELLDLSVHMTMVSGKVEYCAAGQDAVCPAVGSP